MSYTLTDNIVISERLKTYLFKASSYECKKGRFLWYIADGEHPLGNYFDLRDGQISFTPRGKELVRTDSGKWAREGRQSCKLGRFISGLPLQWYDEHGAAENGLNIDKLREYIVTVLKCENTKLNFRISKNISDVYGMPTGSNTHNLRSSCMRSESDYGCKNFAAMYEYIHGLRVVYTCDNEGSLTSRALLWLTDKGFFLDRVYGKPDVELKYLELAEARGWMARRHEDRTVFRFVDGERVSINANLCVNFPFSALNYAKIEGSPYVDTLFYYSGKKGALNLFSGDIKLRSCDGHAFKPRYICSHCDSECDEEDGWNINGEFYCTECRDELFFYCDECNEYFIWDDNDYLNHRGRTLCESCANNNDFYRCENCGEWTGDHYTTDSGLLCDDCFCDKYVICTECEEHVETDEARYNYETGEAYCEDCFEKKYIVCECGKLHEREV